LEVGSGHPGKAEARRRQQVAEQIALGLIERRQFVDVLRVFGHEIGQGELQRGYATEVDVLMHLAQFSRQGRWRDHVAGFPAGDMVGLAKGADHERTQVQLFMGQHAHVGHAVEYQVFVDLIADQVDIAVADQFGQLVQLGAADQRASRVVRGVEDDHARAWRQRGLDLLKVQCKALQAQLHMDTASPGQFDRGLIAVVAGIEHDDFIATADHRLDRTEDRSRGTGGDGHFAVRVDRGAIAASDLARHLLTQRRKAGHRGVLVMPAGNMFAHGIE